MNLIFKTPIPRNYKRVAEGFTSELFLYLTPSWLPGKLIRFDGCKIGNEVHIELGHPKLYWVSEITDEAMTPLSWHFVDEGKVLPWPLKKWRHKHSVVKISDEESQIIDDIEYHCSNKFLEKSIYPMLYSMFSIRPARYKKFFKDHA
jgi:ligand-binding SRPBCC domain-containing protein